MSAELNSELLLFHHVGCAVKNIEEALSGFLPFFPKVTAPTLVGSQKVRVCFLEVGPGSYIEFIEAVDEKSAISVMLKRGISFYHLGFMTAEFERAIAGLARQKYRLLEEFSSEAFGGRRCAFLMSETMQLVEVIESGCDVMGQSSNDCHEADSWG